MPLVDSVTMSSTLAKGNAVAAGVQPAAVLDTTLAKSLSAGRPALLLSLLVLRFYSLVAEPVSTLYTALPVVAAVQVAYAVVCLPVAGAQTAKTGKKSRPGEKKKSDATGPFPSAVCNAI